MSLQAERRPLARALAISIALHCMLVPLFVISSAQYESRATRDGGSGESTSIAYLTISHRSATPAKRSAVVAHAAAVQRMKPAEIVPHAKIAATRKPRTRDDATSTANRAATAHATTTVAARAGTAASAHAPGGPVHVAVTLTTPAPENDDARTAATALPSGTPSPPPTPAPSPSSATGSVTQGAQQIASRGVDVSPGGWGQSFEKPLVADESALAELRAKFHGARAIAIDVDEAGHATHVTLPGDLPSDVRAEIERNLLSLRYVPAECNGLRCTGTLSISL